MRAALMAAMILSLTAPAFAQSKAPQSKECKPETMEACVKRQMGLRDAVSGIAIQRGDAERFCNRKSQRC
jgi:hypothetical protein